MRERPCQSSRLAATFEGVWVPSLKFLTKRMWNCASAAGAGCQGETVDSNWHWDGEEEGPISATYPKGIMIEKSSQLIQQMVFSMPQFGINASALDFMAVTNTDSWMLISIPLTTMRMAGTFH